MAVRLSGSSSPSMSIASISGFFPTTRQVRSFPVWPRLSLRPRSISSHTTHAKKRNSYFEPVLKQSTTREVEQGEQVAMDDDEEDIDDFVDEFEDEMLLEEDEEFEDDFEMDDADPYVGDGAAGGGVSLAGTWWDKEALAIAQEVSKSLGGDLKIYAFKTSANSVIRVRIEKLSSKYQLSGPDPEKFHRYGSPSMTDIEEFSSAYQERLDEAERAGTIPKNISLEVSSPGVERVVRIPEDLERFKDRSMYVRYTREVVETGTSQESDGVFRLLSFNMESGYCMWGLADVRINREKAGKGRPLSKKQREWRLQLPFDSLVLVRLYSEC